jgi:hypothetical protein
LSERSPLPPDLSAKNLLGGRTRILNVSRIQRINRHPVEGDEDSAKQTISDTNNWLHWNADLDNANEREEEWVVDNDSDIEHNNGINDSECPEQKDLRAAPNVPGLVWPTQKSKIQTRMVLLTLNAVETQSNQGGKKK